MNYSKKMSQKQVLKHLLNKDLRNDFILNYSHFENDANSSIDTQWIAGNLASNNNNLLENIFDLSVCIGFFSLNQLSRAREILDGRYFELTKLAVLDWILVNNAKIEVLDFYHLNVSAFNKTKLNLVKLQAAINLTLYNDLHISKVHDVLSRDRYPTAFYRLVNSFPYLDVEKRELLRKLILNNFKDSLDSSVFCELESIIKKYTTIS